MNSQVASLKVCAEIGRNIQKQSTMSVVTYIKESFKELNDKVTWMPLPEAQKSTVVVAVFTVLFALSVFLVDRVFQLGLGEYFKLF